jgi:type II secretory pathway component GspD/PulD (secretin)
LVFSVSVCLAQEGRVVHVYHLQTSDTDAIREVIEAVIGDNGKVKLDKAAKLLIVTADEKQQTEAAKFIKELDRPVSNVQIEVATSTMFDESESNAGVGLNATLSSARAGDKITIKPHALDHSGGRDSTTTQLLVAASGREAALRVVTDEAFVEWLLDYGQMWGYITDKIIRKEVGAKLWICPTIIGNGPMVSITLTPEISFVVDGNRQLIRFVKASIKVIATDGQPITVAAVGDAANFYNRFLTGLTGSGRSGATTITLTPRILPAARPPEPGNW